MVEPQGGGFCPKVFPHRSRFIRGTGAWPRDCEVHPKQSRLLPPLRGPGPSFTNPGGGRSTRHFSVLIPFFYMTRIIFTYFLFVSSPKVRPKFFWTLLIRAVRVFTQFSHAPHHRISSHIPTIFCIDSDTLLPFSDKKLPKFISRLLNSYKNMQTHNSPP